MGRFLAFLLVFVVGGLIGLFVGGFGGALGGSYVGACKVIDSAVATGSMTQEEADQTIRAVASDLGVKPEDKQAILDALKRSDQPETPCTTAIRAL
jgi:polyhydroxyalkanoate synthesis regulator phasin